jgi:hypothetical protein
MIHAWPVRSALAAGVKNGGKARYSMQHSCAAITVLWTVDMIRERYQGQKSCGSGKTNRRRQRGGRWSWIHGSDKKVGCREASPFKIQPKSSPLTLQNMQRSHHVRVLIVSKYEYWHLNTYGANSRGPAAGRAVPRVLDQESGRSNCKNVAINQGRSSAAVSANNVNGDARQGPHVLNN